MGVTYPSSGGGFNLDDLWTTEEPLTQDVSGLRVIPAIEGGESLEVVVADTENEQGARALYVHRVHSIGH